LRKNKVFPKNFFEKNPFFGISVDTPGGRHPREEDRKISIFPIFFLIGKKSDFFGKNSIFSGKVLFYGKNSILWEKKSDFFQKKIG
jgi:hypothetical protein